MRFRQAVTSASVNGRRLASRVRAWSVREPLREFTSPSAYVRPRARLRAPWPATSCFFIPRRSWGYYPSTARPFSTALGLVHKIIPRQSKSPPGNRGLRVDFVLGNSPKTLKASALEWRQPAFFALELGGCARVQREVGRVPAHAPDARRLLSDGSRDREERVGGVRLPFFADDFRGRGNGSMPLSAPVPVLPSRIARMSCRTFFACVAVLAVDSAVALR